MTYFLRQPAVLMAAIAVAAGPAAAQVSFSGSFRTRVEVWDWFHGNASNYYGYSGSMLRLNLRQSRKAFDWQMELAVPIVAGLPDDAIAAGPQGQFGFGAAYYVANGCSTRAAMLFPKQGFIRFNELGGRAGQTLKLGRMEFVDGADPVDVRRVQHHWQCQRDLPRILWLWLLLEQK